MLNDFSLGLDFLAALCTLLYIARLLVFGDSCSSLGGSSAEAAASLAHDAKKRSLLNQQVKSRLHPINSWQLASIELVSGKTAPIQKITFDTGLRRGIDAGRFGTGRADSHAAARLSPIEV